MKLAMATFLFEDEDGKSWSVRFVPKGSDNYSDSAAKGTEVQRKYEVQILRSSRDGFNSAYKCSYYSDHAANKSNAILFLDRHFKQIA